MKALQKALYELRGAGIEIAETYRDMLQDVDELLDCTPGSVLSQIREAEKAISEALAEITERLARLFSEGLKRDIGRDVLAACVIENTIRNDGTCATHDRCDANVAMINAFFVLFGRDPEPNEKADAELINNAWSLAKARGFFL